MDQCIRARFVRAALFSASTRALSALLEVQSTNAFRSALFTQQRAKFDDLNTQLSLDRLMTREIAMLGALDGRYLTPLCDDWPHLCRSPALFRVMGRLTEGDHIAIIGARNASSAAMHRAWALGRLLAKSDVTVVSGGALGIDMQGLEGARLSGGRTLTIFGSGLQHPSPRQHLDYFRRHLECGAILSSFQSDQRPTRWSFVRRNRWISELSHRVVVMQASASSGALKAARHSLSLGRRVYVNLPSDADKNYEGCMMLRDEGAQCLSRLVGELVDGLGEPAPTLRVATEHQQVLRSIAGSEITCEKLSERLDLGFKDVLNSLIELECNGLVHRDPFGRWYRRGLFTDRDHGWWL